MPFRTCREVPLTRVARTISAFGDGVDALAQRERALQAQLDGQDDAVEEADQPARLRGAPTDPETPQPAEEADEVVVAKRRSSRVGSSPWARN